jgi:dihydrofolate reductase
MSFVRRPSHRDVNERGATRVPKVIYSMSMSLDGFIADPNGEIDWTGPDEELHRFHNDRAREQRAQLLGRRLYEAMLYWDGFAEREPAATEAELDFARLWEPLPKIVFSRTLTEVRGANTRLAQGRPAEELERLKAEPGDGDIGVGGAGLAADLLAAGLVDELHLFVAPIVLGGGTRFFPPLEHRIPLELVEQREFAGGVQHLRYRTVA